MCPFSLNASGLVTELINSIKLRSAIAQQYFDPHQSLYQIVVRNPPQLCSTLMLLVSETLSFML